MPSVDFWTSNEYSGFLASVVRELRDQRVSARQRFHISDQDYRKKRGRLGRLGLRSRQYILYPVQLLGSLVFQRKPGILVVTTNTFYAPLLASFLHPRCVFLLYDLFPEALIQSGGLKPDGILAKTLSRITDQSLKRCSATVFLNEGTRRHTESHHATPAMGRTIPVGATGDEFPDPPTLERVPPTFLYSGNFGRMHETETILGAFENWSRKPAFPDAFWRFQCSGPGYPKVEAAIVSLPPESRSRFTIGSGLPFPEWVEAMKRADIALVTMRPGAETVVMPSKTYSALVAGQAVLAVAPENSDLADLIHRHDCGWVVKPGDVDGFIHTVESIAANPGEVLLKRQNAYRAGHEHYSAKAVAKLWIELFEELLKEDKK